MTRKYYIITEQWRWERSCSFGKWSTEHLLSDPACCMNKLFTNKRDAIKEARIRNEKGKPFRRYLVHEVILGGRVCSPGRKSCAIRLTATRATAGRAPSASR